MKMSDNFIRPAECRYTEASPCNKPDLKSLDRVLFNSFSKILRTKSKDVIDWSMHVTVRMSPWYRCCK